MGLAVSTDMLDRITLATAIFAFAATIAYADDRTCGKGVVGFEFDSDRPNLAVRVNGVKLYELVPSGLAEVNDRFEPLPSRTVPTLTGTKGSWGPVQCNYWTTWVARVEWRTSIEIGGEPVSVSWKTVVSVDPSAPSYNDPRVLSNAVEWSIEIKGWPPFASEADTMAFGVMFRPTFDPAHAMNGGPDFIVLPEIARYDGAIGDVAAAFCSSKDYHAGPWPPCPNQFSAFEVCETCAVAELNFSPFEQSLQYPAPATF